MKKEMTHTVEVREQVEFGKTATKKIKVRLLKKHLVSEDGGKFRIDNGQSLSGWKYRGSFIGSAAIISTLTEIGIKGVSDGE
jgi:hypothetical protein